MNEQFQAEGQDAEQLAKDAATPLADAEQALQAGDVKAADATPLVAQQVDAAGGDPATPPADPDPEPDDPEGVVAEVAKVEEAVVRLAERSYRVLSGLWRNGIEHLPGHIIRFEANGSFRDPVGGNSESEDQLEAHIADLKARGVIEEA